LIQGPCRDWATGRSAAAGLGDSSATSMTARLHYGFLIELEASRHNGGGPSHGRKNSLWSGRSDAICHPACWETGADQVAVVVFRARRKGTTRQSPQGDRFTRLEGRPGRRKQPPTISVVSTALAGHLAQGALDPCGQPPPHCRGAASSYGNRIARCRFLRTRQNSPVGLVHQGRDFDLLRPRHN